MRYARSPRHCLLSNEHHGMGHQNTGGERNLMEIAFGTERQRGGD
jgi:hypothetical protein